jgi:hypothetical protein
VTQTVPIVLNQGATLLLSVKPGTPWVTNAPLFAQISGLITAEDTNFWNRPAAGVLVTHCLRPGREVVRVIQFDPNPKGPTWFSPAMVINAAAGKTNEVAVELTPGVSVHGKLDEIVPRPVRNGRVIARVSPAHEQSQNSPPDWHTWTKVADDGTFEIESLPTGELELVAICEGFVNTNGPGQFTNSMHYPQKFLLETNELEVMLGMEPTAVLEVMVKDNSGKPLKDATVSTWPNVRYGEWSATILGQDCYHTADSLRDAQGTRVLRKWWFSRPPAFQATTDVSGVAVILNLPREANVFDVGHARFSMPAKDGGSGQKTRQESISLRPGQTNHATVQLVPAEGDRPIAHY